MVVVSIFRWLLNLRWKEKNENIQIWSRYSLFKNTGCSLPASSSAALSREWRCSWSSADRRCSNYIEQQFNCLLKCALYYRLEGRGHESKYWITFCLRMPKDKRLLFTVIFHWRKYPGTNRDKCLVKCLWSLEIVLLNRNTEPQYCMWLK